MRLLIVSVLIFLPLFGFGQKWREARLQLHQLKGIDTVSEAVLDDLWTAYTSDMPDSALQDGMRSLQIATRENDALEIGKALNLIGSAYFYKNNYPMADDYFNQAIEFSKKHELKMLLSLSYRGAAVNQRYQDKFVPALNYYLGSLRTAEELNDEALMMKSLTGVASVYLQLGDPDQAMKVSKRAYRIGLKLQASDYSQSVGLTYLGTAYMDKKQYDSAYKYLKLALEAGERTNSAYAKIVTNNNLGKNYLRQKRLQEAEFYITRANALSIEFNSPRPISSTCLSLAELRWEQGRVEESIQFARQVIDISIQAGGKHEQLEAYLILAKAFAEQGKSKDSNSYWQKAYDLSDSVKGATVAGAVAEVAKRYELSAKESQISELTSETARKDIQLEQERRLKYFLATVTMLVMIIAGFALYNYRMKTKLNEELNSRFAMIQQQKAIIESINLELQEKAFRAQINPHFIFNCLNSIQYLIAKGENEEAFTYLTKFSILLRKILEYSDTKKIGIAEEIELLEVYLELESLRFDQNFKYQLDFQNIIDDTILIPPLMIQPFVENAIIHGLLRKNGERVLNVSFDKENGNIVCRVRDNGIGREAAKKNKPGLAHKRQSRGIELSKSRLTVHNNKVDDTGFVIEDMYDDLGNPSGTLVTIKIAYERQTR